MKNFFERFWVGMKRIFRSDARNFLHFFLAFTGIFLILAAIMLSILRFGMYRSTDQTLMSFSKSQDKQIQLANFGLRQFSPLGGSGEATTYVNGSRAFGNDGASPGNQGSAIFNPNTYVVLYDGSKKVLNAHSDYVADAIASNYSFNDALINHISLTTIKAENEPQPNVYRTLVIPVNLTLSTGEKISYMQVLISVDQIQSSLASTSQTIIWTIVAFWLLSLFVAIYLSHWSMRPLQLALDRQKAFVSNASHELRTPLAILQNRLQLLFQNPTATIIDESENISASLNEVRNMRLLTTNLLDLARQDQGMKVEYEEVTEAFFVEIFTNYKMLAEDAEKSFRGSVVNLETVKIDPDLTKQLLTIFFDNALKYTGDDGQIEMTVKKTGQTLELTIADNGAGIPDADKKKIFDRFYRVNEARTRGKGGLGLGLSLAQLIVSKLKGKISVSDNNPHGTIFSIKLKL